jgi:hypothetical protein
MPEIILARIQRCHGCRREMSCPPLEYAENPFCRVCLKQRVKSASPRGGVRWRREGHYVIAEAARKHPLSERKHHPA